MKKTALIILLIFLMVPSACSKKEVKPVSQESKTAEEAMGLAEKIRDAFVKNDRDSLLRDTTESGFKDIFADGKSFDSVELVFTPRWVDIEQARVTLNLTWKSKWTIQDKQVEDRGMAVFEMEGQPLKLTKIIRSNPFKVPGQ
jgi:hypothetical protein